jgi:hypothetical protein
MNNGMFYVEGDEIVLTNTGNTSTVVLSYYMRPNDLVTNSRVADITQITTGATTTAIKVSTIPTNLQSTSITIDIIEDLPNNRILKYDVPVVAYSSGSSTITIANANVPAGLSVGDHIALSGETKVPQVPSDVHSMLAQAVACRVHEAQGAQNELAAAYKKLEDMREKLVSMLSNRTEGTPQKVNNVAGFLRRTKSYGRGGSGW